MGIVADLAGGLTDVPMLDRAGHIPLLMALEAKLPPGQEKQRLFSRLVRVVATEARPGFSGSMAELIPGKNGFMAAPAEVADFADEFLGED